MTREEQIFDIASQYAINETDGQNCGKAASKRGLLLSAFRDGAHWADQHPQIVIDKRLQDFKKEVEALKNISDAEEYAKQLAHLFLGNGLSLKTILLMAIDFGQQHPNWIKVDENNLPPKLKGKQYTEYYLVYSSRGVQKMRYNYDRRDWQDERGMMFIAIQGVTHWMPIVPPRKEDKK